jgi:hypothetical protein
VSQTIGERQGHDAYVPSRWWLKMRIYQSGCCGCSVS